MPEIAVGHALPHFRAEASPKPEIAVNRIRLACAIPISWPDIPASARAVAKISCRLVASQDPGRVAAAVRDHILKLAPPTVACEVIILEQGAPAFVLDRETRAVQAASVAYEKGWGKPPIYEWAGGSVPITYALAECVDEVVLMGYGTKSGRAHGPNENIHLNAFERGIHTTMHFYSEYAARWR